MMCSCRLPVDFSVSRGPQERGLEKDKTHGEYYIEQVSTRPTSFGMLECWNAGCEC